MFNKSIVLAGLVSVGAVSAANAGSLHIADFRLKSAVFTTDTSFDPGFVSSPLPGDPLYDGSLDPYQTRGPDADGDISNGTQESPIKIFSHLSGGSQNANGSNDFTDDIRLRTYSSATHIRNLSRFGPSLDGISGPSRIGMAQWNFDLTDLETYLTDNSLSLTALDLGLTVDVSDHAKKYSFYLSYTNPAESITQASIDNSTIGDPAGDGGAGANNWTNFFQPAIGASAGTIVNGTHKVLVNDQVSVLGLNESILSLYDAGVRNFNLQLAAGDFWSGRQIKLLEGSGLSIDTTPDSIAGDLDGDGFVGLSDLDIILNNWNLNIPPGNPLADPTGDLFVGLEDLDILLNNWNAGTPPGSAVPEPATLGLLTLGGAALLRKRA